MANINGILGIEENLNQGNEATASREINNSAEKTLIIIGNIILWVGLLAGVICLFNICWVKTGGYYSEYEFNPIGFATTIGVILSSLLIWAFLRVLANISMALKEINLKQGKILRRLRRSSAKASSPKS